MILYESKLVDTLSRGTAGGTVASAAGLYSEALVGVLLPGRTELSLRGLVYSAAVPPGTGVAPGTAISTTAAFNLHNPQGSGKLLVVLAGSCGYVSGTLGAGAIYWCCNPTPVATAPSGTAITAVKTLVNSATTGCVGLPTYTTTVAQLSVLRPAFTLGAALASTAGIWPALIDKVDGEFVVAPGCSVSLHGLAAAGSSPLVSLGLTWAEIPA
jgi:hypothetical protein